MSQAELAAWLESRDAHWCSQYQEVPAPDEESEIVAQFLAAPYPYQNDDDDGEEQEQKHQHQHRKLLGEISATASSTYWPYEPGHASDPGTGACGYWPSNGDASNSNSSGSGAYFDGSGCCYYYLAEPDVSLGIKTRTTLPCASSIDLNLLGDGEEEGAASLVHTVPPNPSPVDHRGVGDDRATVRGAVSAPKRKAQAVQDGGDLGRRHRKKEKKAASSKVAQKCSQESTQSRGSCSAEESNCSEVNCRSGSGTDGGGGGGGGNAKARAAKGSATDPQSLYARRRRERINERLKILQKLVPNGTKVDISTMLEEAVHYVRFLQQQIKMLSSDEMWMYAPIAYNGMSLGIDLKIATPQ